MESIPSDFLDQSRLTQKLPENNLNDNPKSSNDLPTSESQRSDSKTRELVIDRNSSQSSQDTTSFRAEENRDRIIVPDDTTLIKETVVPPTLTAITEKLNETDLNKNNDTNLNSEKKSFLERRLFFNKKTKIQLLLESARQSLYEFFSPFSEQKRIPSRLFNETKGIVFLSVIKGALGIGGMLGSGIILARNDCQWSNPCALSTAGTQIGFNIGIETVDHILLLRDEPALKLFLSKEAWNLGTDVSIAAGPVGGDINLGVIVNDAMRMTSVYSYSIAKGAYIGLSLNGSLMSVRGDWNEEFYGRKIKLNEILNNFSNVSKNDEYVSLINSLNECCRIR